MEESMGRHPREKVVSGRENKGKTLPLNHLDVFGKQQKEIWSGAGGGQETQR